MAGPCEGKGCGRKAGREYSRNNTFPDRYPTPRRHRGQRNDVGQRRVRPRKGMRAAFWCGGPGAGMGMDSSTIAGDGEWTGRDNAAL